VVLLYASLFLKGNDFMFGNPYYNNFSNPIDRIDNQMKELENLKRNYQNSQTQPIQNIINTNGSQIDFEARILNENEKPDEILIQRKTAFIDLKNGVLSIKELNGEIKSYKIELPKTPEQLKIEELEKQNKELISKLEEKERKSK
jgi:hypothetical protein